MIGNHGNDYYYRYNINKTDRPICTGYHSTVGHNTGNHLIAQVYTQVCRRYVAK